MKYLSLVLCFVLITFSNVFSQQKKSLKETLQALSMDAAKSYVSPVASAYGANLNAGWFHRSPQPQKIGFDIEVGFVVMGALFPKNDSHFSTSGTFRFSQDEAQQILQQSAEYNSAPQPIQQALVQNLTEQTLKVKMEGATIIGSKEDKITISYDDLTITDPNTNQTINIAGDSQQLQIGGYRDNLKVLPLFAPQLSLGTIYGTVATIRYLPGRELNDLGRTSYFGFGLQHNPAAWLDADLPLDLSAGFFTQNLNIGDLLKSSAVAFGINASKQFGHEVFNFTPYAGFMLESSSMHVKYDFIVNTPAGPSAQKIDFKINGKNKTRLTLGLSIRLLIININADYNIGQYNNFSIGLNFAI